MFKKEYLALLTALLLSLHPLHIQQSHYATNNVALVFFICLSTYFSVNIYLKGNRFSYIWAGIFAGFAISTKYTGGLIVLTILIAHLLNKKILQIKNPLKKFFNFNLSLSLLTVLISFAITSPFILFDSKSFPHIKRVMNIMLYRDSAMFAGVSNGYAYWINHLIYYSGYIVFYLFLFGFIVFSIKYFKESLILISFSLPYLLVIGSWNILNLRYLLPVIPFFSFFSSYFLFYFVQSFCRFFCKRRLKSAAIVIILLVIIIFFFYPVRNSLSFEKEFVLEDTRTVSLKWINQTLPSGSVILREQYTPEVELLNKKRYEVINRWYELYDFLDITFIKENSVDYVIISSHMYARYYKNIMLNREKILAYENIHSMGVLIKEFIPSKKTVGPTIKIYKIQN